MEFLIFTKKIPHFQIFRHFAGAEAFPGGRLHGAPALPGKTGEPFHGKAFRAESFPPFRIAGDPIDHYAAGKTAGIGSK